MNIRANVRIHGRVQGVFYRQSATEEARRLGVTGWVRNLADGSVELVAEGPEDDVRALVRWCEQGPPAAAVDSLDVSWVDAQNEFRNFDVR